MGHGYSSNLGLIGERLVELMTITIWMEDYTEIRERERVSM